MRRFLAFLIAAVLMPAIASAELRLQTTDPAVIAQYNDRFSGSASFIGASYNWSGIGQDSTASAYWATMISPSYFLTSAHYAPIAGDTLVFYVGNNTADPVYAIVSSTYYNIPGTDLELGKLNSSLAGSGVAIYAVGQGGSTFAGRNSYVGQTIYVAGKTASGLGMLVGENVISAAANTSFYNTQGTLLLREYASSFDFHSTGGMGEADCQIQSGDSGGPSFIIENGQLVLEGIHYANGTNISYDTFVPAYVTTLDAHMVGEQITIAPEPATMLLLLGAPLLLIRGRSGVRRRAP